MVHTLQAVFARAGREQLTGAELARAGFTARRVAAAVRAGALRTGVTGFWLPRAADPGAAMIFRNALRETAQRTED